MSLEDLRRMGLLREGASETDPGPRSGVSLPAMLGTAAVAIAGAAAMVLGDGGALTWIGIVAFLAGLFGFIWVNVRGVA